jgi:hypothetical protein
MVEGQTLGYEWEMRTGEHQLEQHQWKRKKTDRQGVRSCGQTGNTVHILVGTPPGGNRCATLCCDDNR